jgi:hypothetical protein
MIWLLPIPFVLFFTFKNLIDGDWLMIDREFEHFWQWPFLAIAFTIFVGLFISALISGALIGVGCAIGSMPERVGIEDKTYDLVTLRERDGVNGQFYFLGAGSIHDVQYYFWYRRNADGTIAGGKTVRAPGVRIHEIADGSAPRMMTFRTVYSNAIFNSVLWQLLALDPRDEADWFPDFYIPKGSIKEGYAL